MPDTLLELCQQLVEDAGISGDFTSAEGQSGEFKSVVGWIKRATTEIEGKWFDWDFLHEFLTFDTVVATSDYPAPANHNFWDKDTCKLLTEEQSLEFEMWTRLKTSPVALVDGDPYMFTILPDKALRLYDTPDSVQTISIEYWRRPTILALNDDEPAIPSQFRDIIVSKALQYYANHESADEVKVQALEQYNVRIVQLESHSAPSRQARDSINTGAEITVQTESGYYEY